jgi:hypothetical protein
MRAVAQQNTAVSDSGYNQPQATSSLFKNLAADNPSRYTIGTL